MNDLQEMTMNHKEQPGFVNSVFKAICVLECFSPEQPVMSLGQISKQLSLPKSTVSNLIKTLEQVGYLTRGTGEQGYRLGYKILGLSYSLRSSIPVVQYALPFLEDIQLETGEIVYLTTHIEGRSLYLEGVYPSRRMEKYSISGKTLPMHCTGGGKAILSYLPKNEVEQIIDKWGLPAITKNTITDRNTLLKHLEEIRERGFALDIEEETPGVKCIAKAIRNSDGYATGAISISGTTMSMQDDLLPQYAQILDRACSTLMSSANQFPAGEKLLEKKRASN
ncbi:MAG: IclR family transcriptional regulator [Spirochaetales bacterium]|nr:IclR family transcriptional regulator [Spirochaetales bacterium]